jgi:hypothetical protein
MAKLVMKRLIPFLFVILIMNNLSAQPYYNYKDSIDEASNYFSKRDYLKSAQLYTKSYLAIKNLQIQDVICEIGYKSVIAWTLAEERENAIDLLNNLIDDNYFLSYYSDIGTDSALITLHNCLGWRKLYEKLTKNKEKLELNQDNHLIGILDSIYQKDQTSRLQISDVLKKYGSNSNEFHEILKKIHLNDSLNLVEIKGILDKYGWLGIDKVGLKGSQTLFLVIQHSNIGTQTKYLPVAEEATRKGLMLPSNLALLKDKIAFNKREKQIYGSQIWNDVNSGILYVYPIEDPENVDYLRTQVGLPTMKEYLKLFNMNWDMKEYTQKLPDIERNIFQKKK